ncbi:MAG TPA: hypothetical protein VFK06_03620 [Candidatus Angelobacter sp.]|nr:hypothetical protein [Candidatus Angelobacter sp.]
MRPARETDNSLGTFPGNSESKYHKSADILRTPSEALATPSVRICTQGVVMMASLLDMLFGCWHKNLTFPLTSKRGQRRSNAASATGTYVVCLECGREFPYDWEEMKVIGARPDRVKALAAKAAES